MKMTIYIVVKTWAKCSGSWERRRGRPSADTSPVGWFSAFRQHRENTNQRGFYNSPASPIHEKCQWATESCSSIYETLIGLLAFFHFYTEERSQKKHDILLDISRNRIVKSIKNFTTFQTLWSPEEDTSSERSFSKPACKWDNHLFVCFYFWHLMQIVHIFWRMLFKGNVNPNIWIFLLFKGGGMYPRNLKIILLTKKQFSWEWEDTF